ncbi:hypothetical protein ACWKWP_05155 [Agromyces soli]
MTTRSDRLRRVRRRMRPESTRPAVVVFSACFMLVCAGLVVLCAWLLISTLTSGASPFDTVGIARPTPVWLAMIGCLVGIIGGGALAYENAAYLVRVVRKTPKLVYVSDEVIAQQAKERRAARDRRKAQQRAEWQKRERERNAAREQTGGRS